MSCMTIQYSVYANHEIKRQATSIKSSQPGDCQWPHLIFLRDLCGCVWAKLTAHANRAMRQNKFTQYTGLLNYYIQRFAGIKQVSIKIHLLSVFLLEKNNWAGIVKLLANKL